MLDKLKQHFLEIMLVLICLGFAVDYFWPKPESSGFDSARPQWATDENTSQAQKLKPATVGYPETVPPPAKAAPVDIAVHDTNKKNISAFITHRNYQQPFPFSVYRLNEPLLPKTRLLDIIDLHGSFWFSSDSGLLEFNELADKWWLRDKDTGLPGDSAYDIGQHDGKLLLDIKNWKNNGKYDYLSNVGYYWFMPADAGYVKTSFSIQDALAGQHLTTENSDLIHNRIADAVMLRNELWIASIGDHDRETREFVGGGVSVLDPASKQGRQYTTADGLASAYSYRITADDNGAVWVVHYKPERGVSVLHPNETAWQTRLTSSNNIKLGGVGIAAAGKTIIIGQQSGLVIYNPTLDKAIKVTESQGLPGYIVSDLYVTASDIWASVYGYAPGGKGSDRGGLVKINRNALEQINWTTVR